MAYFDDDDFEGRSGGVNHSRVPLADTSNFNTAMLSEDGRFLGIKVPPGMEQFLNFAQGGLLKYLSEKIESLSMPAAEKVTKWLIRDEQKAFKAAGKIGSAIGYGVILSPPISGVGRAVYDSVDALNNLRLAVKPLSKSATSSVSPLSGDNEVIENARRKINGVFWMRLKDTAVRSITIMPALIANWHEKSESIAERERNRAIDHAKNAREVASILEKERSGIVNETTRGSVRKMAEAERILIDREYDRYKNDLQSFVSQNSQGIQDEIRTALTSLNKQNARLKADALEEMGVNVRDLRFGDPDINSYKTGIESNLNELSEAIAKKRFERKYGGFDKRQQRLQSWLQQRNSSKLKDENKNSSEAAENTKRLNEFAAGIAAATASEVVGKIIGESDIMKLSRPIAIDRILHLRRVLEQAGDNPPESVAGIALDKIHNEKDMGYVQYVHTVFRQHQRDSGRPDIGERFFEHFENAHWDDKAIQQLPDEQLTQYEFAVKTIAKRIKDGRMDAIALINLVGDKNKKIVRNDSRSFGPKGSGKNDEAVKAAMLKIIDEQTLLAHAGQKKSDTDINEKLGNFVFSIDDLKMALNNDATDKQQRAFVFTIFSDAVGNEQELCKLLEIDDKRCTSLREETKSTFNATLDGAVLALAEALQSDKELEKKLKLMEKEKDVILELADRIKQDGKDVADLTTDRQQLVTLETVVANAVMKGGGLWSKMVEKAKTVPDIIADAKKRREEAATVTSSDAGREENMSWPPGESLPPAPPGGMERHQKALLERSANREEPSVPGRA